MAAPRTRVLTGILATGILATATILRFWRLTWGLADREFFFDEWGFAHVAEKFLRPSWESFRLERSEYAYPTFYSYLSAAFLVPGQALGLFGGQPLPSFLAARIVSTLAGLVTVVLVGVVAKRFYGRGTGLAAAGLLAVAPLHVMHSHIAATDITLTAGFTLTLLLSVSLATRPTARRALAAGAAAALTFGTKYTGLAAVSPVGWALVESSRFARSRPALITLALVALIGFGVAFTLACPPCVLHPDLVFYACGWHQRATTVPPFPNNRLTSTLGWYGRPYLYEIVASLPYALGWPLHVLALVGVVLALWRHALADRLLLATIVPYFLVIGGAHAVFPRYLLPLVPPLVILAARAVTALPGSRNVRAAVFAAVWLYSLALSASQVARFSWTQQRAAAEWVKAYVGSTPALPEDPLRVASPGWFLSYFHLPRAFRAVNLGLLVKADGEWLDDRPDVFVMPDWYATAIKRDVMQPGLAELERIESGAAGYRPAARFRSSYLQERFYTWLDPAFAVDLWQGEIGFTVYVRARTPAAEVAPAVPPG
jgi:4-amino-4-deoxy-L-arabinose transferase-like glycosyltransferase